MKGDIMLFHLALAASGARTSPGRAMLIFGLAAVFGGLVIFAAAHGPRFADEAAPRWLKIFGLVLALVGLVLAMVGLANGVG
jgi:drug/metabolite transporter superfamily protein YnfA